MSKAWVRYAGAAVACAAGIGGIVISGNGPDLEPGVCVDYGKGEAVDCGDSAADDKLVVPGYTCDVGKGVDIMINRESHYWCVVDPDDDSAEVEEAIADASED